MKASMNGVAYQIPLWDVFNTLDRKPSDMSCYDHVPSEFADAGALEPSLRTEHIMFDFSPCGDAGGDDRQLSPSSTSSLSHESAHSMDGGGGGGGGSDAAAAHRHPSAKDAGRGGKQQQQHQAGAKPTSTAATRRRPRAKKDPNEPQKPASAYSSFFHDVQPAVKQKYGAASFGQISKIVAGMWDGLDHDSKERYKDRTEKAKQAYLKELAAYRANISTNKVPVKTPAGKKMPEPTAPQSVRHSPLYSAMQQRQPYFASQNTYRHYAPAQWTQSQRLVGAAAPHGFQQHVQRNVQHPMSVPHWNRPQNY